MLAVGLALDDELPRGALQPVDGGLGEQRVGHDGQPLARVPVRGQHGGRGVVALDDELVDVGGLGARRGLVRAKSSMIEQVDADELAHLGVVAGVEAGRLQSLVQLVGPFEVHADAPAAGDVAEGGGHEGLADADRARG